MKFSEVTAGVIALAACPTDPPEPGPLRRFLLTQPPATLYLLMAVAHLGTDQFGPADLVEVLLRVGRKYATRREVASDLAGLPPLAEWVANGVRKLTAARVNLDRLHAG